MRNMIWDKYLVENILGAIEFWMELEMCVMEVKRKNNKLSIRNVWKIGVRLSGIGLKKFKKKHKIIARLKASHE